MVPKILEKVIPRKQEEKPKRTEKKDPLLERLRSGKVEEKISAFDEIMQSNPDLINRHDVFSIIQGDKDLIRHAVLSEYHVDMDEKTYTTFKRLVKETFTRRPLDAIMLLQEITDKNMKRRESIERTLDLFDDVLAALPAKMSEDEEREFLKFYGKFKRKMREFSSQGEENREFAKKMIVKSGHRVARILSRIADNAIGDASREGDMERGFQAWKRAHSLKMEALWLLQKMAKHGDPETVEAVHGRKEQLNVILQNAMATVLRPTDHKISPPLEKRSVRQRMLKDRATQISKILNRGLQHGTISVDTAKKILELAVPAVGNHLHEGIAITVADLARAGRTEEAADLLGKYVLEIKKHASQAYAGNEVDFLASVLEKKLRERSIPRDQWKIFERALSKIRGA